MAATALVQSTVSPMWALDQELRLCFYNDAFTKLVQSAWGRTPALGLSVQELPASVAAQHREAYRQVLAGRTLSFPWTVDSLEETWEVTLRPIERDGTVIGVAAVGHDISARERIQQELVAARTAAERANAARSEFLAMVSHELRTPLNAIVGLTRVALESLEGRERGLLERVERNATQLSELVSDLLDFSRIDGGLLKLRPEPTDLRGLLVEEVDAARVAAEAKGLELALQLDERLPSQVEVDPDRVRQVVTNLVSNAVRNTHHGRVAVEITWIEDVGVEPQVQLTVRDTGIGIARSEQKLIFTRFYRSTRSASERSQGTGLGLTITKAIVEHMGGRIRLRSEPGQGSVFSVRVPTPRVRPRTEEPEPLPMTRQAHVLVADDNPDNLQITRLLLERAGDRVTGVRDGQAALDAYVADDFDLVVMDVDMEPMDGVRATREIRAREDLLGLRRVPIVALTAHAVPEVRRSCEEAGMDGFLTKPVDPAELAGAVARWLGARTRIEPPRAPVLSIRREVDPDIADLVPEFLEERRADVVALHEAIARDDRSWIRRKAHQIRGTGTSYGYPDLTELGGRLEEQAETATTDALRDLVEQIAAVLAS